MTLLKKRLDSLPYIPCEKYGKRRTRVQVTYSTSPYYSRIVEAGIKKKSLRTHDVAHGHQPA